MKSLLEPEAMTDKTYWPNIVVWAFAAFLFTVVPLYALFFLFYAVVYFALDN
jgi:hypothetical protein